MFKKDDYIEGKEYYGNKTKKIRGWVDRVRNDEDGLSIDIQCDDKWKGARGNTIHENLGEIKLLDKKERPKT